VSDPLNDRERLPALLAEVAHAATRYLAEIDEQRVHSGRVDEATAAFGGALPEHGDGSGEALALLAEEGIAAATRSAGPRFFHFVTGGSTPAALAADWLASALDQNSFSWVSSPLGSRLEKVAMGWLKELFGLPAGWGGVLTTGATMANFSGLAAARRWWAGEHGVDVDLQGFAGLPPVPVLTSGYIHASAVKALGMLGVGRAQIRRFSADPAGRLDRPAFAAALADLAGAPAIVIASAGEVNAGDFDPIAEMVDLAHAHHAWVHVDGAFGLFARASTQAAGLANGVDGADSVIADGHKWLNVPYDCGFAFVRDPELLHGAFQIGGPYLPVGTDERPSFADFGPEASRRARALAVWATLKAYGREGYREMVDRHIRLAQRVGAEIEAAADFELLAPVRLNVVCFRYRPQGIAEADLDELNRRLGAAILADGRVFYGTTVYAGKVAFRPAISNWRTTELDVDLIVRVARSSGNPWQRFGDDLETPVCDPQHRSGDRDSSRGLVAAQKRRGRRVDGDHLENPPSCEDHREGGIGQRLCGGHPRPCLHLARLRVDLLSLRHARQVEAGVEPAPKLHWRDPTREIGELVESGLQVALLQRRREVDAVCDSQADAPGVRFRREAARTSRQEDSELLEELPDSGAAERIAEESVLGVDASAGKHVCAGCEIGAAGAPQHEHLPRFGSADQEHRCGGSRLDRRAVMDEAREAGRDLSQ
jgi:glutamate/tyrosine decarboxylase-like PLP-dependent enzyme